MDEAFWNVFHDTGDPLCYLLYKADCKREEQSNVQDAAPECNAGGVLS